MERRQDMAGYIKTHVVLRAVVLDSVEELAVVVAGAALTPLTLLFGDNDVRRIEEEEEDVERVEREEEEEEEEVFASIPETLYEV